jgi:hypothetical protein
LEQQGDAAAVYFKAQKTLEQKPKPASEEPCLDAVMDWKELMEEIGINLRNTSNDVPSQVDQMNIDAASTTSLDDFYVNEVNGNANFFLTVATNTNEALNDERQSDIYKSLTTALSRPTDYNDPNEVYIDPSNGSRLPLPNDKLLRVRISQCIDIHIMMQNKHTLESLDHLFALLVFMGDRTQWYDTNFPLSLEDHDEVYGIAMSANELIMNLAVDSANFSRVEVIKCAVRRFVNDALARIGGQQVAMASV